MSAAQLPAPPSRDLDDVLAARYQPVVQEQPAASVATTRPRQEAADYDEEDDLGVDDTPSRSIGRAGRGKANKLIYASEAVLGELLTLADDVHYGSRGRVHRWRVIDEVITRGMTPANKRKILRKLGLEDLITQTVPEDTRAG